MLFRSHEEHNWNRYVGPGSDAHAFATGNFESTSDSLIDADWDYPKTKHEYGKNPNRGEGHAPKYKK